MEKCRNWLFGVGLFFWLKEFPDLFRVFAVSKKFFDGFSGNGMDEAGGNFIEGNKNEFPIVKTGMRNFQRVADQYEVIIK